MNTKSVILLLDSLPIGLKTNIAAVLGMSLGRYRPDLVGGVVVTADGRELPGITTIPLPILNADETVLRDIFLKACELDLLVAFGAAALSTKDYDEYRKKLSTLADSEQGVKGLLLCGPKKTINRLVGQLALVR